MQMPAVVSHIATLLAALQVANQIWTQQGSASPWQRVSGIKCVVRESGHACLDVQRIGPAAVACSLPYIDRQDLSNCLPSVSLRACTSHLDSQRHMAAHPHTTFEAAGGRVTHTSRHWSLVSDHRGTLNRRRVILDACSAAGHWSLINGAP